MKYKYKEARGHKVTHWGPPSCRPKAILHYRTLYSIFLWFGFGCHLCWTESHSAEKTQHYFAVVYIIALSGVCTIARKNDVTLSVRKHYCALELGLGPKLRRGQG